MKKIYFFFVSCILVSAANAQMTIGSTNAPDGSAVLDLHYATTLGLYAPQVSLTATNSATPITLPQTSLLVYNTATAGTSPYNVTPGFYYNAGTTGSPNWVKLLAGNNNSASDAWLTTGNIATNSSTNFIGTTDGQDFVTKTNGTERMRVFSGGGIGIGTTTQLGSALVSLKAGSSNTFLSTDNNTNWQVQNTTPAYEFFLTPRGGDNVTYMNYGSAGMTLRNNGSLSTLFMTNANQVGINMGGTTTSNPASPTAILEVAGNNLQTNTAYEALIKLDASTSTSSPYTRSPIGAIYHSYNSASYLGIEAYDATNSSTKRAIALNEYGGNVGIGTSNPTQLLNIYNNTGTARASIVGNNGTTIFNVVGSDPANGAYTSWTSGTDYRFSTATSDAGATWTERMRILSTGAIAFNGAANYGSAGQVLQSNGNAAPTWVTPTSGTVTGIGIVNYLARWTPSTTALGTGVTQDNGTVALISTTAGGFSATERLTVAGGTLNGINATSSSTYGVLGSNTTTSGYGVQATNVSATGYALYANNTTGATGAGLKVSGTSNLIGVTTLGTSSSVNGSLVFNNGTNANTTILNAGVNTSSYGVSLPVAPPTTGQVLTAQSATQLNWTTPTTGTVTGSGVATQVAFWNGTVGAASTTLNSNTNLFWDNTNYRLGIGTGTTVNAGLDVESALGNTFAKFGSSFPLYAIANAPILGFNTYYNGGWKYGDNNYAGYFGFGYDANGAFSWGTAISGFAGNTPIFTPRMEILNGGQVTINTTSPITSDLLTAQGSGTYLYPVNGYATASSGIGVYGSNTSSSGIAIEGYQGGSATSLIPTITGVGGAFSGITDGIYTTSSSGDAIYASGSEVVTGNLRYINGVNYIWPTSTAAASNYVLTMTNAGTGQLAWSPVSSTGTVTSIGTGTGLTGGPITTSGTISLANGTAAGQTYVTGASPYTPALVTMSQDATIAATGALTVKGLYTIPISATAPTNGQYLAYNGANWIPTTLPSSSLSGTAGGVFYGTGASYGTTAAGTAGQVLISNGASAPSWGTASTAVVSANDGLSIAGSTVQLGGNALVANTTIPLAGNNLAFTGAGNVQLGDASSTGKLQFLNSGSANAVTVQAGTTSSAYAITLPTAQATTSGAITSGSAYQSFLTNDGTGTTKWGTTYFAGSGNTAITKTSSTLSDITTLTPLPAGTYIITFSAEIGGTTNGSNEYYFTDGTNNYGLGATYSPYIGSGSYGYVSVSNTVVATLAAGTTLHIECANPLGTGSGYLAYIRNGNITAIKIN